MAYDQHRVESHGRSKSDRRSSFKDVREDSMFWRREQPEERQSRRLPGESRQTQERSSVRSGFHEEPAQSTATTHTTIASRTDRSEVIRPLNPLSRRQSTSGQAVSEPSTLEGSLAQRSAPNERTLRPGDDRRVVKSTDPRSRDSGQQSAPSMDTLLSSSDTTNAFVPSPINDGQENMTQGGLIRDIADAVAARHATKKEYEQSVSRSRELKEQVDNALQMFPKANPYVEKLTEELKTVNAAMERKRAELEKAGAKEQAVLHTYAMQSKVFDSMTVELQRLRDYLDDEQQHSRKLRVTNVNLQDQIAVLTTRIDNLSGQVEKQSGQPATGLQERLNHIEKAIFETSTTDGGEVTHTESNRKQISELQKDIRSLRGEDIEQMRAHISDQKLALARLSDIFASQTSLETLSTRVDKLSATPPRDSGQPLLNKSNFITQANLDQYVLVFNQFETVMKDRLDKLEADTAASTLDLDKRVLKVDFDSATRTLAAEQATQDQKIAKIVSDCDQCLKDFVASDNKQNQVQERLNALIERFQALQKDYAHLKTSLRDGTVLQEMDSFKAKVLLQERTVKAHTHSINSLNQRFNNLTTEQLARHMLAVLDPMLTTIKPRISDMQTQMQNLQSQHDQLRTQQSLVSEKSTAIDVQTLELQKNVTSFGIQVATNTEKLIVLELALKAKNVDHSQKLQDLQEEIDTVQTNVGKLQSIRSELTDHFRKDFEQRVKVLEETTNSQTSEAVSAVRQATEAAIHQAEQKQETYQSRLLLQVKEARDSIDGRLTTIEDRLGPEQDEMNIDSSSNTVNGHGSTIVSASASEQPSTVDKASSSMSANGIVANTTGRVSKDKASLQSKPRSTKSKPLNASPLAKHFQSRSVVLDKVETDDDDEDTIDATPKPKTNIRKIADKVDVVCIADSDQEDNSVAADENISSSSDQESIDMNMWQKHNSPQKKRLSQPGSSPAKRSTSIVVTNSSAVQAPQTKRKRELSNNSTPRSTQDGTGSGASTPHSVGKGRKKAKV